MKNRVPYASAASILLSIPLCLFLFSLPKRASAQGSLTPPPSALSGGVPVANMVTLQQIEPRTPISQASLPTSPAGPYVIATPGSYYLTTNITVSSGDAIDISASGVTLDLNGFTISSSSTSSSGNGVAINLTSGTGNTNITIVNGHIYGEFIEGVSYVSPPSNVRVSGVSVAGCTHCGIHLATGSSTVIESCTASSIGVGDDNLGGGGIDAGGLITQCTVTNCYPGISVEDNGVVIACAVTACFERGIDVRGNNCAIKDCNVSGNEGDGIYVDANSCAIKDCNVSGNEGDGIYVDANSCMVKDCNASGNMSVGIYLFGENNRIDSNTAANNTSDGIFVGSAPNSGNSITRNSAAGNGSNNTSNYSGNTAGNPDFAPVQTPLTASNPFANF